MKMALLMMVLSLVSVIAGCGQQTQEPTQIVDVDSRIADSIESLPKAIFPTSIPSNGGTFVLEDIKTNPVELLVNERFSFSFTLIEAEGRFPVREGFVLACEAVMPAHHHGMNYTPKIVTGNDGKVEISGMMFHMKGNWRVFVDVTVGNVTERVQWDVTL